MTRPVALAMALLAAALLLVGFGSTVHAIRNSDLRLLDEQAVTLSSSYARELQTRMLAAQALVQGMAVADAGAGGTALRQQLVRSDIISGVALAAPTALRLPVPLNARDQQDLLAGQTLLRPALHDSAATPMYLVRMVKVAGNDTLAFFELNNEWLWQGLLDPVAPQPLLAVIDASGTVLATSGALPPDLASLFAQERLAATPQSGAVLRDWSFARENWRGAVTATAPNTAHLAAGRWMIIASSADPGYLPLLLRAATTAALLVLFAALLITTLCWTLRRRWEPALEALTTALRELAQGRYERVALGSATDAPRVVAAEFNSTIAVLEERMRGLASLNDIDRLLLEAGDVESCLDRLLERISDITGCDGAMLALLDPDATDHGRAYVTSAGGHAPVSRIILDALMLSQLCQERGGLTVARFEPGRHSLLEPLRDLGAEFFWLWPVLAQDTLVATLAVGYRSAPAIGAEVAGYGTECAARIGVALSNSARGEQLYRQAHFDPLTALPNRLLFREHLAQELASAADGQHRGALLYVDLDHFKKINDTVGHSAGDQLLQIVAQRLRSSVKEGDTVARLGGDEFTVILRGVETADAAQRVAARIIDTLQQAVSIGGRDYYVRASIGITLFPDDGTVIDELMRNADLAMYRAKEHGRSRAVHYDSGMQRMPALAAESGLYRALQRREFSLYYQPQYSLANGGLVALEALLRWQPPREGMRYPAEFVPAAEQSGLIVDIGAWVLDAACEQMARWCAEGIAPARLALNISVHQLRQADFPKLVRRALDRVGVPPERLEFEITESVFADDDARVTLRRLASLGVRLSLDDFGTGYSSLGYLRAHPVQAIKIDRSFIEEITHNGTAATLAETMITMAHALGKQVVAEGVETMEQLEFLRARHCDFAQGFYFARPATVTDVTEQLRGRRAAALPELRAAG